MLNAIKKNMYKTMNGHVMDAEALLPALGNKEAILKVVAEKDISGGKWELVFQELYKTLEKGDGKILKNYYFDIAKCGEIDGLWDGFKHHELERQKQSKANNEKEKETVVDDIIKQASESGMPIEELVWRLYNRMPESQNKQIPKETAKQTETKVEKEEEPIFTAEQEPNLQKDENAKDKKIPDDEVNEWEKNLFNNIPPEQE